MQIITLPFTKIFKWLPVFYVIGFFSACNPDTEPANAVTVRKKTVVSPTEVQVASLSLSDFGQEIISNGKINAKNVAALKFVNQEVIKHIFVKNGMTVTKGQKLAQLETYALEKGVEQAYNSMGQANLEYQNMLIGQGYKLNDINKASKEIKALARIKSGLSAAQTRYEMAQFSLRQATLISPINGQVANLFAKQNTLSSANETFCEIIDLKKLEVIFPLLENELEFVKVGNGFKIMPFSNSNVMVSGVVIEINPTVDANGMVKIKGSIKPHSSLIEGMNVHVTLNRNLSRQLVVPKEAVVQRAGKQVVFSLSHGKAQWNYVTTMMENSKEYAILSETLKKGDIIIYKGNLTLAHNSPVKVIKRSRSEIQE